jgi:hypothetical protein
LDIFFLLEDRVVFDKKYKVCHNLDWSADDEDNLCWNKLLPAKLYGSPLVMKGRKGKLHTKNASSGS